MNGGFATATGTRRSFAVDRNRPTQRWDEATHTLAEAAFKQVWVEQTEDAQKGVFLGDAVFEHEVLSQPGGVRTRLGSNVFNRIAVRKCRRDRHHQQLLEVMPRVIARLARGVIYSVRVRRH